jgi:glutamine amidotransferase
MITIIDYGMGNLGSILNMCRHLGIPAETSGDPATVVRAEKLILPGVGAFDAGMEKLDQSGLREALDQRVVRENAPILGICLGMQLLARRSEEGVRPGLGWIAADVVRFQSPEGRQPPLQIPHMGWSHLTPRLDSRLFAGLPADPRFYFVHSYHVVCDQPGDISATTEHGGTITAAIERGHILGTQFHPEKSHRFGMQLLRNFARL